MRFSDARVVFVHICGPADAVGADWWCLVRRWVFEHNKLFGGGGRQTDRSGEEEKEEEEKSSGSGDLEFELLRKEEKKSGRQLQRHICKLGKERKKKEVITVSLRRKKGNRPERSEYFYAQKRIWLRVF